MHHRCRWHRWQMKKIFNQKILIIFLEHLCVVDLTYTVDKFFPWHRRQICHRCRWYRWCTLTCEYLREFSKKFQMKRWFMKKIWGKNLVTLSLKRGELLTWLQGICPCSPGWRALSGQSHWSPGATAGGQPAPADYSCTTQMENISRDSTFGIFSLSSQKAGCGSALI